MTFLGQTASNFGHDESHVIAGDGSGAVASTSTLAGRVARDGALRADAAMPIAVVTGDDVALGATVIPAERSEWASRVMNVTIAAIALLILAPICVLVALAIKLTSRGPVFYTQTRVGVDRRWRAIPGNGAPIHAPSSNGASSNGASSHGASSNGASSNGASGDGGATELADDEEEERRIEDIGGAPFTILKFRSMTVDAEKHGQAVWATKHDARVTPVGRVLRLTRLDEVPQLINVLRGEMNIVGPRPERPSIFVRLREHIGEYPLRQRVRPGITGWAQINHSYDSCIEDVRIKVRYDLEYIREQSLMFDLKIMLLTVPVMLFKRGAH